MLVRIGLGLYAACVDFMVHAANLAGATYRDANAFMFFVLWPLVTVGLAVVVAVQRRVLIRLRRERGSPRACPGGRGHGGGSAGGSS